MNFFEIKGFFNLNSGSYYFSAMVWPDKVENLGVRAIDRQFNQSGLIDEDIFPEVYREAREVILLQLREVI